MKINGLKSDYCSGRMRLHEDFNSPMCADIHTKMRIRPTCVAQLQRSPYHLHVHVTLILNYDSIEIINCTVHEVVNEFSKEVSVVNS